MDDLLEQFKDARRGDGCVQSGRRLSAGGGGMKDWLLIIGLFGTSLGFLLGLNGYYHAAVIVLAIAATLKIVSFCVKKDKA